MPFEWVTRPDEAPERSGASSFAAGDPPLARLVLWPHRSLPRRGFVWFTSITAGLAAVPLVGALGTPVVWVLLPFLGLAVAGIWWALSQSYRDGRLTEELHLWRDRIELVRDEPDGARRDWVAEPFRVKVALRPEGGPVANYLTLKGAGREVEIGAFLAPGERAALRGELVEALARAGRAAGA